MRIRLTRRTMACGAVAIAAFGRTSPASPEQAAPVALAARAILAERTAQAALADIERRHGGRLGVFALDTGTGHTLANRPDERFLLCSSFKMLLAAMVLWRVDHGQERLDRPIRYQRRDLLSHAPTTTAHLPAMTVGALCQAAVAVSDNTAANLLLHQVGGPAALTGFLRGIGDPTTRLDRFELALNSRDGLLDTTTPRAIVGSARTLLLGTVLSDTARITLEGWMAHSTTGLHRLRAVFPQGLGGWAAADKTGTGPRGETNDIALARPPGRPPLVMAAYYDPPDGLSDQDDRGEQAQRETGAVIVAWANARPTQRATQRATQRPAQRAAQRPA